MLPVGGGRRRAAGTPDITTYGEHLQRISLKMLPVGGGRRRAAGTPDITIYGERIQRIGMRRGTHR